MTTKNGHKNIATIDQLIEHAHDDNFKRLNADKSFKDLSTVIITPVRGDRKETGEKECPHCGEPVEYDTVIANGFSAPVLDSWRRLIKPMNHPVYDLLVEGMEVGDAYEQAVENVLAHPQLRKCKYILFLEDDVVLPYMPGTSGPLWQLYERLAEGWDVVSGLYWTKGEVNRPLIFGDPTLGTDNFECLTTGWNPGDVVECNGSGMGFTLCRTELFKDKRLERPWFKTLQEDGAGVSTQDLFWYRKIRALGYKVAVDTGIRCGHYNVQDRVVS